MDINRYAKEQIDNIKEKCKILKPVVVIRCITYNHEPYLRDALEGFIMQKTDFPFVAVVHDDASTDGTVGILKKYAKKYPEKILPIYEQENQYSMKDGSIQRIMDAACYATGAKYMALCEGDDYWIDPLKLQRQIDFLNTNEEYSACVTKFKRFSQRNQKVLAIVGDEYNSLEDMLAKDLHFGTATLVTRSICYRDYLNDIQPSSKGWLMGDKPLVLYMGAIGKVKTLPSCTTVYRILEESASHSSNISLQLKRAQNTIEIYKFYANKYLPNDSTIKTHLEGGYLFRAYKIYREARKSLPGDLKTKIIKYQGSYKKLYLIKIFIKMPILADIAYKFSAIFHKALTISKKSSPKVILL